MKLLVCICVSDAYEEPCKYLSRQFMQKKDVHPMQSASFLVITGSFSSWISWIAICLPSSGIFSNLFFGN